MVHSWALSSSMLTPSTDVAEAYNGNQVEQYSNADDHQLYLRTNVCSAATANERLLAAVTTPTPNGAMSNDFCRMPTKVIGFDFRIELSKQNATDCTRMVDGAARCTRSRHPI
jgi:hypothetical protein